MLRIHLFGHPQVIEEGQPRPLPTPPKVFELWAYLLLHRRDALGRDHLAYTFWLDVPEEEARAKLRRHLHLLRRQLPPPAAGAPWILSTRHTVQWNPDAPCWLDVAVLEDLDPETADEDQWMALLDGYRGELLTGLYADWVLIERERLHQRFLHLCEMRIEQQRAAGDLSGAIATTRRLLAHDPLREEPYRYLMEFYYRAGDRAAALREFERCEAMLHDELNASPMPETLALRDAILRDAVVSTPAPDRDTRPANDIHLAQARAGPRPSPAATGRGPGFESMANAPGRRPVPPQSRRRWSGVVAIAALVLALVVASAVILLPTLLHREPETASISGPRMVQDTWLNFAYPDLPYDPELSRDPYATYPQVHLSYWGYPYDRVLIRFDLSWLPPRAEVQQATLHLYLEPFLNEDVLEPRPATISAFRLLTPWEADTATFNSPWSQPGLAAGVDYAAAPQGSDSLYGSDWVDLDMSEAVRDWLAHPDRNFGVVVMITAAPRGAHYWVDTSDYPLPDRRPRLDIVYTP